MTVRLAGNRAGREVKLEGIHPDMEGEMLLRRACNTFGVTEGATIALRIKTRLLGAEETLAEAGTSTMDVINMYICEGGGMPKFVPPESGEAHGSDEESPPSGATAGVVGALLGELSRHVSEIEGAVQRLNSAHETDETPQVSAVGVPAYTFAADSTPRGVAPAAKACQGQLLQLKLQVEEASRKISIDNVKAVHEKYSKGSKDGIKLDTFKQALAEVRQEFGKVSDEEANRYFIDMDVENNKALDFDEFRRALQKPFPIEQALSALPLSRVIASSLPGLHSLKIEDHLEAFSNLKDNEVSAMASAVSYELEKLLLDMVRDLRKGFEVRNSSTGADTGEKFSAVVSGGSVRDFHAGLAHRVGELHTRN